MKKLFYLFSLALLALSSCSRGNGDILSTVPDSTEFFVVADLKALVSDLGDEGRRQLASMVDKATGTKGTLDARWRFFFSEDSGVDFASPFAVFEWKGNEVATFYVKDASKFRKGLEKETGVALSESSGFLSDSDGTVFIHGDQVWFAGAYPELSVADFSAFLNLGEKHSILSNDCAAKAASGDADLVAFVNLDKTLSGSWNANLRMAVNAVFDDASYVVTHFNFEKGKARGESVFYNYKGRPAGLAFDMDRIDVGRLKVFDGRGNCFAAMGVSPEVMHSLVRQAKNFGVVPADAQDVLESLDGNVAFSLYRDPSDSSAFPFTVMLSFGSDKKAAAAVDAVRGILGSDGFRVYSLGNGCFVSHGSAPSGSDIASVADDFKGACLGVAFLPSFFGNTGDFLDSCVITLHNDGDGARILSTVNTNKNQNALTAVLRLIDDL